MNRATCTILFGFVLCLHVVGHNRPGSAQGLIERLRQRVQEAQQNANGRNGFAGINPLQHLGPLETTSELLDNESIDKLVQPLDDALRSHPAGAPPLRIAVFVFGDQNGEVTEWLVGPALDTQGAINAALRKKLLLNHAGKFVLLDQFELQRTFRKHGKDPASVSPKNSMLVDVLKQVEIDAAVVGTLAGGGYSASVVFAGAAKNPEAVKAHLLTNDFNPNSFLGMQRRIGVTLQCRKDGKSAWETIPLVQDKDTFGTRIYAAIEPRQSNYEYQVLVAARRPEIGKSETYLGGIANPNSTEERNRLFGVAVLIDGVNSIFEDNGSGGRGPIAVPARDARKWIIGPPGYVITAQADGRPFLRPANGPDHSTVAVRGFQNGDEFAQAFQLAKVDAQGKNQVVVAEALGITQSIGLISVFIFSEKLSGDKQITLAAAGGGKPSLGTAAGRLIKSPVTSVKVDFHRQPVEQIHIHYRLKDEIPFPQERWLILR